MPRYSYLALRGNGQEIKGSVEGPNPTWVSEQLRNDELLPIEIVEQQLQTGWIEELRAHLPVSVEDVSLFCSQFALMIRSGLPILSCLDLLAENSSKVKLRNALLQVAQHVRDGGGLASGLRQSGQFPDVFVNMVAAGETGGQLDDVLAQLSLYLAREAELRGKVKKALSYPAFLLLLAVAVTVFLLVAIIPRFTKVLGNLGVELPFPTRVLLATSGFLVEQWPWVLVGLAGSAALTWFFLRDDENRRALDQALLRTPLFGELIAKNSLARFSYVTGSLLAAGIPIIEAMDVARRTAGNRALAQAIGQAREELIGGRAISDSLAGTGQIPPLILQMVQIGESSGTLDQVLTRVAEIYDQQVDRVTSVLVSLIEPSLIVLLGGVVGFIALSLVLPMVRAVSAIGG